ncbi:hypothetical protein [Desulforamulus aquiferis]|uniref:Uncharacterized protein n=1 Tax=Desulforamulus aquiferis TaxID=1397668 RepID=A0AAW7Z5I5_9FIRM|nr:hypothetical protein [Desulforamulus aquiferis]MDO7785642.1 hypothetical protein [Desulforamulus aquiferis]RYD03232.1 hypothetical protein N752_20585 [Desulforamulus aquiferis]
MQRLPEQDIYIYKAPDEELHKILVGDLDGKRLKVLSKREPTTGKIIFKVFSEDAHKNMETIVEGNGPVEDFDMEMKRLEEDFLKPLGETWREVSPKVLSNLDPKGPCVKGQ